MTAAAVEPDGPSGPGARRRDLGLAALVVLIVGFNTWWLLTLRDDTGDTIMWLGLLGCVAFAVAGAVAMRLRPGNPTGAALLGLALLVNIGEAEAETMVSWRYTIGRIVVGAPTLLLPILALCFPTGRPRSRWGWLLCLALVATLLAFWTISALWAPPGGFCLTCAPAGNLFFTGPAPFDIYGPVTEGLFKWFVGLLLLTMVTLLTRWVRATRPARRVLSPILLTTVLLAAKTVWDHLVLFESVWGDTFTDFRVAIVYPQQVLQALIPLMFLLAVARSEFGRSPLARLLADVVDERAPARVDHALKAALRDPNVRVGYRAEGAEGFVDLDGRTVDLPGRDAKTAATLVGPPERPFAVIVHDAAIEEGDRQLEAAVAAAGMALRRERLRTQLRVRLQQLSESRERLIGTVDEQRDRMEAALEQGVEARLLDLSSTLDELRTHVDEATALEALDDVAAEVGRARSDLRALVRNVRPAVLAADGLATALQDLAHTAPVPVAVRRAPDRDLPTEVEGAIWFVCSESIVNVAKHARATRAEVDVAVDDAVARVTVTDDGQGGAAERGGSGLRGLRERVEAVGGTLSVLSAPGSGTTVRAELPLETARAPETLVGS